MNTANALGYLLGAIGAARLANRLGGSRTFLITVTLTATALLATGLTGNTVALALLRLVSGATGGVAFVVGGGLVAQASANEPPRRAVLMLGIYFGGAGLGIVLSGLTVPILLASFSRAVGWRLAWGVLGSVGLLTLAGVVPATRHVSRTQSATAREPKGRWPIQRLWATLFSYGLYGAGYIAYMTFIIAFLKKAGAGPQEIMLFWAVLGSAAMASAFLWSRFLGRAPGGLGVAGLMVLVLIGVALPLASTAKFVVWGSALFFGIAFLAVITAVTTCARRNLPSKHWTTALAYLTAAFGLGQSIGPVLAGLLSNGPGGIRSGLILSAAILIVSILIALAQRDVASNANHTSISVTDDHSPG